MISHPANDKILMIGHHHLTFNYLHLGFLLLLPVYYFLEEQLQKRIARLHLNQHSTYRLAKTRMFS